MNAIQTDDSSGWIAFIFENSFLNSPTVFKKVGPTMLDIDARMRLGWYSPFILRPSERHILFKLSVSYMWPSNSLTGILMLQVQGYEEHFLDSCPGPIGWIASNTLYLAFSEGWALYAENPLIPEHTKMYEIDPLSKYGMLKWQVCSIF